MEGRKLMKSPPWWECQGEPVIIVSSSLLAPGQQKHAQLPAPKSLNQQIITLTLQMFNFLLRLHRVYSRRGGRGNNLNPKQLQERCPPHGLLPRSPKWGLDVARGAP